MKILWLCNGCPAFIQEKIKLHGNICMGWLDVIGERMATSNELSIVFSYGEDFNEYHLDGINVYTYPSKYALKRSDEIISSYFQKVIQKENPNVVHIHGTEYPHSYAMTLAAKKEGMIDKVIVSIQGLVSVYADNYYAGLDEKVVNSWTIRDLLRLDNIKLQKRKFKKRGITEKLCLKNVKHVIGRTDWDKACCLAINPNLEYHFVSETLRHSFYENKWDYDKCEKHSIFVSQSAYPIKGLHKMIEAMPIILKKYPDAKVYVTGNNIFNIPFYKINSYQNYLKKLILENNLKEKIVFTGMLNEQKMCQRYLDSNVFVLCSAIENSPNSLGEAMIMGVPCVSSFVGGVSSMMRHNENGYLYPFMSTEMLANYVIVAFEAESFEMQEKAKNDANERHSITQIFKDLELAYSKVINNGWHN